MKRCNPKGSAKAERQHLPPAPRDLELETQRLGAWCYTWWQRNPRELRIWPVVEWELFCKEVLSRILKSCNHWLSLTMEKPIIQERNRSEGHLLLIHDMRIRRSKDTAPALEGGSSHEVDAASGSYDIEVLNRPYH